MKIVVISDIHGIKTNIGKVLDFFHNNECDKLVVLGDVLNNGFYTYDYDPQYIEKVLKSMSDSIICVRGNCDYLKDIMDITHHEATILEELETDNTKLYFTHGHVFNEYNWDKENSILIFGHTHRAKINEIGTNLYINPGSISKPRGFEKASFLYFDDECFIIYDIDNKIIAKKSIKNTNYAFKK